MTTFRHCRLTIAAALLLFLPGINAARAALILDVIVQPSTTRDGQAGAFDVIVTDAPTSTQAVTLAGFSVDVTVPTAMGITFTGINAGTSTPYLFAGNNLGFLVTT